MFCSCLQRACLFHRISMSVQCEICINVRQKDVTFPSIKYGQENLVLEKDLPVLLYALSVLAVWKQTEPCKEELRICEHVKLLACFYIYQKTDQNVIVQMLEFRLNSLRCCFYLAANSRIQMNSGEILKRLGWTCFKGHKAAADFL